MRDWEASSPQGHSRRSRKDLTKLTTKTPHTDRKGGVSGWKDHSWEHLIFPHPLSLARASIWCWVTWQVGHDWRLGFAWVLLGEVGFYRGFFCLFKIFWRCRKQKKREFSFSFLYSCTPKKYQEKTAKNM